MIRVCARDKNCFSSREKSLQSDHWRSRLRLKRLFSLPLSHQNRTTFYVGLRWFYSYTAPPILSQRSAKAKAIKGAKGGYFSCNQTVRRYSQSHLRGPRKEGIALHWKKYWPASVFSQIKSAYSHLYTEIFMQLCIASDWNYQQFMSKKNE